MAFSDPYLNVGQVIVVVKMGNIVIGGWDSLAGMAVGVLNGSPSASAVQNMPNINMVAYPTYSATFKDLINGSIDAVVASKPRALSYTSIPANKLKIVSDEFGTEDYGIAICPQDAELAQKINDGLAAIKADGTLDKLTRNWLKNSAIR
jgi:polar amino acid transport system substrate-binding protein